MSVTDEGDEEVIVDEVVEQPLDGVVSLGMSVREDVECPACRHSEAAVTHNAEGQEVLCCLNCENFWRPFTSSTQRPVSATESHERPPDGLITPGGSG